VVSPAEVDRLPRPFQRLGTDRTGHREGHVPQLGSPTGGAGLPLEPARSRLARWDPPGTIGEPGDAGRGSHPHA
jgi:hypothetical protein